MAEKPLLHSGGGSVDKTEANTKLFTLREEFTTITSDEDPENHVSHVANGFTFFNINDTDNFERSISKNNKSCQLSEDAIRIGSTIGREYHRLFHRRRSVVAESFDPNEKEKKSSDICPRPKSKEECDRLFQAIKEVFIFKSCTNEQLKTILNAMFEKRVKAGQIVIKQGEGGDNFYVIEKGHFDVIQFDSNGSKTKMASFSDRGSFGELALLYNCPRAATVLAVSDGILWCLCRSTFKHILVDTAKEKRIEYEGILQRVPMLNILTPYERETLADALGTQNFKEGQCIIREGETFHSVFFIKSGTVRIAAKDKESKDEKTLTFATKDDFFGELALVSDAPCEVSVFAIEEVSCAVLDVSTFERLFGSCSELIKKRLVNYNKQSHLLRINSLNFV